MPDSPYPRDMRGYGQHTPDPQWPNGARLAINFVMNYEEGSEPSVQDGEGHTDLVEHHCPIRGAADSCGTLCDAELTLFEQALGPDADVERHQHLLDGGQRCTYRVTFR